MVLDEESATLTTFDTPFGLYYWRRLPFGLSVSSEIFQKRIHQAYVRVMYVMTWLYKGLVALMNRLMQITTEI